MLSRTIAQSVMYFHFFYRGRDVGLLEEGYNFINIEGGAEGSHGSCSWSGNNPF